MSATWTNEPSGATNVLDHNFNVALGSGMSDYYHRDNPNAQLVDLNESWQVSTTKCYRSRIEAGQKSGGTELQWNYNGTFRDMFVGLTWRTNAQFEGRPVGNKMFFMRGPDSNGVFLFNNASLNNGAGTMIFAHNTGGLDNSHIWADLFGATGYPNLSSGTLIRGTGYKLEAYIRASTTNTSRDGIVKWWINGIPVGSYTNVNYASRGMNNWCWSETWDGFLNPATTVAWEHYLDHLYISIGGTSGGGVVIPPEPDPLPVPVTLQSLTPANLSTVVGTAKQFTISMSGPVLSGTSLFTFSSDPTVATVPASVTIPAGSATTLVTATPLKVGSTTISTNYNSVTKAATLQVGTAGTTTGSTVYDYSLQFSGTQGQDNWYYLENTGAQMTYNGTYWSGTDTYGGSLQNIWDTGFHPGGSRATVLRFVVPTTGSATITGSFYDLDTGGGIGAVARVKQNGVTLFTRTIANGATTGGTYSLAVNVTAGDQIDFTVENQTGDYSFNSTILNPIITLATTSTVPTPTPDPVVVTSVVDIYANASTIVVGVAFTMTVRVSQTVTSDTAVEIRVGSTSVLTAPSSVTVLSGTSTIDFTVTPLAVSLVAVDAVLNGIKRVTINVQPAPSTEPPVIDPGPGTEPDPTIPAALTSIRPGADGASLVLNQRALALQFKYDAQPDWVPIAGYVTTDTTFTHRFTWPSGTTTICYRAQSLDRTWGPSTCVPFVPPLPPPPPPPVNKAVRDKYGINWQLTGKKSPYELKRNGETMDNTFGVTLRKTGDGYMEILQPNGVWLRRNGDSWEFVA